jgi:hypothetical protein
MRLFIHQLGSPAHSKAHVIVLCMASHTDGFYSLLSRLRERGINSKPHYTFSL